MGRVPINIGDSDVANADVVVGAESLWTGKVHLDDDDSAAAQGLDDFSATPAHYCVSFPSRCVGKRRFLRSFCSGRNLRSVRAERAAITPI